MTSEAKAPPPPTTEAVIKWVAMDPPDPGQVPSVVSRWARTGTRRSCTQTRAQEQLELGHLACDGLLNELLPRPIARSTTTIENKIVLLRDRCRDRGIPGPRNIKNADFQTTLFASSPNIRNQRLRFGSKPDMVWSSFKTVGCISKGGPMATNEIEKEIRIDAPIDVVVETVTDPADINRWFTDKTLELDLRPNGEASLTWNDHGATQAIRIETVDDPGSLSRWLNPKDQTPNKTNSTLVEFRLSSDGDSTTLRLLEVDSPTSIGARRQRPPPSKVISRAGDEHITALGPVLSRAMASVGPSVKHRQRGGRAKSCGWRLGEPSRRQTSRRPPRLGGVDAHRGTAEALPLHPPGCDQTPRRSGSGRTRGDGERVGREVRYRVNPDRLKPGHPRHGSRSGPVGPTTQRTSRPLRRTRTAGAIQPD